MKAYVMNTLVIVLIAAVLLSAAYVTFTDAGLLINGELIQRQRHQQKNLRMGKQAVTRSCMYRCCTGTYSLDAVARIGSANIWPLFGSANQLLSDW